MKPRIKVFTLGFCKADIFEFSAYAWYDGGLRKLEWEHYFLDQHYPIDREKNQEKLKETCEEYGINWVDAGHDRGLCNGWNYLCEQVGIHSGETIISLDPDSCPLTSGWDWGLGASLKDGTLKFVCLNNGSNLTTPDALFTGALTPGGVAMVPVSRPTMIGVTAWNMDWLQSVGGFKSASSHWGHLETHLWGQLQRTRSFYGILLDAKEGLFPGPGHAPLYLEYKNEQANFRTRLSFEQWLRGNHPGVLERKDG